MNHLLGMLENIYARSLLEKKLYLPLNTRFHHLDESMVSFILEKV